MKRECEYLKGYKNRKFIDLSEFYSDRIESDCGTVIAEPFQLSEETVRMSKWRGFANRSPWWIYEGLKANHTYIRLVVEKGIMMSDTPMERHTNRSFLIRANGKVLLFGMGLGLIWIPLLSYPEVEHMVPTLVRTVRRFTVGLRASGGCAFRSP